LISTPRTEPARESAPPRDTAPAQAREFS